MNILKVLFGILISLLIPNVTCAQSAINCLSIDGLLINACNQNEGLNEQVLFTTSNSPLIVNNLEVVWPNSANSWLGTCRNSATANLVGQLNNLTCGTILEPLNGIIPPNKKVLLFTGISPTISGLSFSGLTDTLYILFHCSNQVVGNFPNDGLTLSTFVISTNGSELCADTVSYIPNQVPSQDGALIRYTNDGVPSFSNSSCGFFEEPLDASWTAPVAICNSDNPINLHDLVSGNEGGIFSGNGVTNGFFNPDGLLGSVLITYTVGSGSCTVVEQKTITLLQGADPSWTSPGAICDQFNPINFNNFVTGTPGGSWTGMGLAGPLLFPEGINGPYQFTYTVGVGSCISSLTQTIYIGPVVPAPSIQGGTNQQICNLGSQVPSINANGYLSSAIKWYSSPSLTNLIAIGNTFNPTPGANTTVYVSQTYPGCNVAATAVNISFIDQPAAPTVNPSQVNFCPGSPLPQLTATSTSSSIVWFNDQALTQALGTGSTYQPLEAQAPDIWVVTGPASCRSVATKVEFILAASWNLPESICSNAQAINLLDYVVGNYPVTFSGQGVTGSFFTPAGLTGNIPLTLLGADQTCADTITKIIFVNNLEEQAQTIVPTELTSEINQTVQFIFNGNAPNKIWQTSVAGLDWQNISENENYLSVNTSTLTLNNLQLGNHLQKFRVLMNNNSCYDTSSVATLIISDTCLTISEVLDTITYFDTLTITETIYDTVIYSTTDTLIIETLITSITPPQFNNFLVYPNPAHTVLTIDCGNISILSGYNIEIHSGSGQIVFNQNITGQETTINLGAWSNGIYHIKIIDPSGNPIAIKQILIN